MNHSEGKKPERRNKNSFSEFLFCDLALRGRLSSNLVGFCCFLRIKGLFIGIAEQIDAMRALKKLDLQDEDAFRIALRVTLAKSSEEQVIFDKYFRSFWYVWESAGNLDKNMKSKKEESSDISLVESSKKQGFLSINDWLDNKQNMDEQKEAVGYSPIEK